MNKHITRPDCIFPEGQTFYDPFAPVLKSKTTEHEKRFAQGEKIQNSLKIEENKS
ncbi:MAG: hypothetical protein IJC79_07890 [Clostridia bacterium]|nr:hypothetical protein [Clostridia bacterium]